MANQIDEILDDLEKTEEVQDNDIDFFEYLLLLSLFEVDIFSATLESTISRLQFEGLSETDIKSRLRNDLTNKVGAFAILNNSITDLNRYGIREASRIGMMSVYNEVLGGNVQYRWVVARGVKHCQDCEERQGQIATIDEWTRLGLPATGWSRCNFRCYCILDPLNNIDDAVQV